MPNKLKKLRREAIRIQNNASKKMTMAEAMKEAQRRRENPNG